MYEARLMILSVTVRFTGKLGFDGRERLKEFNKMDKNLSTAFTNGSRILELLKSVAKLPLTSVAPGFHPLSLFALCHKLALPSVSDVESTSEENFILSGIH